MHLIAFKWHTLKSPFMAQLGWLHFTGCFPQLSIIITGGNGS